MYKEGTGKSEVARKLKVGRSSCSKWINDAIAKGELKRHNTSISLPKSKGVKKTTVKNSQKLIHRKSKKPMKTVDDKSPTHINLLDSQSDTDTDTDMELEFPETDISDSQSDIETDIDTDIEENSDYNKK